MKTIKRGVKKAELALSIIFIGIIVVITILFLTLMFAHNLSPFSEKLYCSTIYHVQSSTYVPKGIRAEPTECAPRFYVGAITKQEFNIRKFSDEKDQKKFIFEDDITAANLSGITELPTMIQLEKGTDRKITINYPKQAEPIYATMRITSDRNLEEIITEPLPINGRDVNLLDYITTEQQKCTTDICTTTITIKNPSDKQEKYEITSFEAYFRTKTEKKDEATIKISKNAQIRSANLEVIGYRKGEITTFPEGTDNKFVTVGPEPITATILVPNNVNIVSATVDISGERQKRKIDLVFILDTSGSMEAPWQSLCEIMESLKQEYSEKGFDLESTIYGVAHEYGRCIDQIIDEGKLNKAREKAGVNVKCDQIEECWGAGLLYVAQEHPWRPDSDRIAFTISDTGPIGSVKGPPGGEEEIITKASELTKKQEITVFPIYIEQDIEGYDLTKKEPECHQTYPNTCGKIHDWYDQLAQPNGKVTAYSNTEELKKLILSIKPQLPEDIAIQFNGGTGPILEEWGPIYKPRTLDIKKLIESYIEQNKATDLELIPAQLTFTAAKGGTIQLENLHIVYEGTMKEVSVLIANKPLDYIDQTTTQTRVLPAGKIIETIENEKKQSTEQYALIPFDVTAASPGTVSLNNLEIKYEKCDLASIFTSHVIACWEQGKKGQLTENKGCSELIITGDCKGETITETEITQKIIETGLCQTIQNNIADQKAMDCGTNDQIHWNINEISTETNYLISYHFDNNNEWVEVS